ncbi:MAG: SPASM domain-containing protein, partial [Firmicutes bacterium]|nr:SPASM domain-containing protein [Candidatus Stercoripulliclostridium pullicola]
YCLDEYSLGNVKSGNFATFAANPKAQAFIKESMILSEKCKACKYFALCRNGCKRERLDVDKCSAYKKFFERNLDKLLKMK